MLPINLYIIIPALNEQASIGKVLAAINQTRQAIQPVLLLETVVVDNGSTDQTAAIATQHGAKVLYQPQRGYGNACLCAIDYLKQKKAPDVPHIVMFLDADFSDNPAEMPQLLQPIINQNYDLVIGTRTQLPLPKGAMTPPQRFGNWLSGKLLHLLYGVHFTDLGPFRAIKWQQLLALNMTDKTYGWTVEMQAKAAKQKLRCTEIAVTYRPRYGGTSKVSGTLRGTFLAGYKILFTIFKNL